jgi:hypothetical protein
VAHYGVCHEFDIRSKDLTARGDTLEIVIEADSNAHLDGPESIFLMIPHLAL